MKPPHHYDEMMMTSPIMEEYEDERALSEVYAKLFEVTQILERAYEKVTTKEYTKEQYHVTEEECTKL